MKVAGVGDSPSQTRSLHVNGDAKGIAGADCGVAFISHNYFFHFYCNFF